MWISIVQEEILFPLKDNFTYYWMFPTTVFAGLSWSCLAEMLLHSWHFGAGQFLLSSVLKSHLNLLRILDDF